jgi:integrase
MGSVYRQAGRRTWMVKYYRDGRPIVESSGTESQKDARTFLHRREGAIAHGGMVQPHLARLTWEAAAQAVVDDYVTNDRRSLEDVESRLRLHVTPYFAGRRLQTITTLDLRAYVRDRLEAGARPGTVNRELAIIGRAFTLARQADLTQARPHIPRLRDQAQRTGFFEGAQFEAIGRHLPAWLLAPMTFAYYTGWRVPSEVLPLTWAQVDLTRHTVRLDPHTTKNDEGRLFPYGRHPVLLALVHDQVGARDRLRATGVICPYVFPRDGEPIGAFDIYRDWRLACQAAGIAGRIPHDFRRTAVRNLVRAGVPEKTAMQLTGHKTRAVFDRYDIVTEDDLARAVARLGEAAERRPATDDCAGGLSGAPRASSHRQ